MDLGQWFTYNAALADQGLKLAKEYRMVVREINSKPHLTKSTIP